MSMARTKDDIVSRLAAEELTRVRNDEAFWRDLQLPIHTLHGMPIIEDLASYRDDAPKLQAYGVPMWWPYCSCGYCRAAGED